MDYIYLDGELEITIRLQKTIAFMWKGEDLILLFSTGNTFEARGENADIIYNELMKRVIMMFIYENIRGEKKGFHTDTMSYIKDVRYCKGVNRKSLLITLHNGYEHFLYDSDISTFLVELQLTQEKETQNG